MVQPAMLPALAVIVPVTVALEAVSAPAGVTRKGALDGVSLPA